MSTAVLQDWINDKHSLESLFRRLEQDQDIPEDVLVNEPVAGLDIRCGPVLRFIGSLENGTNNYRGSILLVLKDETTTATPQVTYIKGPLVPRAETDLLKGEFPGKPFWKQNGHTFWRFEMELELQSCEQKVRYSVNQVQTFEFFLPKVDQSMNIVSFSCNGFSLSTVTESFKGSLWYDVVRNHYTQNRYHVMIGGGDQVYCDAIKNASDVFHHWLQEKNPIKKAKTEFSKEMETSFNDFYLNQYMKWFGKGYWKGTNGSTLQSLYPFTMASIPSINIYDDHDIIDGFGSYHKHTMTSNVFKGVGLVAYKYYMLFQHQLSVEKDPEYKNDPSWILSKTLGPSIQEKSHSIYARLGAGIGFLGLDCRTERKLKTIVSEETYDVVFDRLRRELDSDEKVKHLLVLLGVPIAYPRLVWLEWLLSSTLLAPARSLAQKGVIAKGLVNEFDGSVEVLDDLNDHWCSKHHKRERNRFVGRLQELGSSKGVRVTILSGDVHLAAVGRFKTKLHLNHIFNKEKYKENNDKVKKEPETDPRLMFNIVSSAIVNAPPPDAMATLLNKRSGIHHFDHHTDEDMVPIFTKDVDETTRSNKEFLNKRNWADLIPIQNYNPRDGKEGYQIGTSKLPGPVTGPPSDLNIREERDLKYKITENSLVTRIHVEKDPGNIHSETQDYEIIVPELVGQFRLENIGVKY